MPTVTWGYVSIVRQSNAYPGGYWEDTYRRIEQSPANAKERPNIDQQTEPIHQSNKDILLTARKPIQNRPVTCLVDDHELTGKSKVEKHECANKLSTRCDEVPF